MGSIGLYPFGSELSEDQCARFEKSTVKRKYSAGETVHQPMSRCEGMVYVVEGSLRIYILSDDGREISLYRLKKGELCVLSASCVIEAISFDVFIEAETDTELLLTDAGTLRSLAEENIRLKCFVQDKALQRFSEIMWILQQVLFFSVDRRLALCLLEDAEDRGLLPAAEGTVVLRVTQEKLAASIGSAREVVSRMLRRFADDGLIRLSRGSVEILDITGLRDIAAETI